MTMEDECKRGVRRKGGKHPYALKPAYMRYMQVVALINKNVLRKLFLTLDQLLLLFTV